MVRSSVNVNLVIFGLYANKCHRGAEVTSNSVVFILLSYSGLKEEIKIPLNVCLKFRLKSYQNKKYVLNDKN